MGVVERGGGVVQQLSTHLRAVYFFQTISSKSKMGLSFWEPSFLASMLNWEVIAVAYGVLLMVWSGVLVICFNR